MSGHAYGMKQHFHIDMCTETRYKFHTSLVSLPSFKCFPFHVSDVSQLGPTPSILLTGLKYRNLRPSMTFEWKYLLNLNFVNK
jgi:hypothetical protein